MSRTLSPSTHQLYGLARVAAAWGLPRSTYYARRDRRNHPAEPRKRGPKTPFTDALDGEATTHNKPPTLAFSEAGRGGAGPGGLMSPVLEGRVGAGVAITVWAKDDGLRSGSVSRAGRSDVPVTLTWFKHSGPGAVTFNEESGEVPAFGGSMSTEATFSEPGEYVLRVRANDASGVSGAGHSQCCWTNGFVKVTVTR